MTRILLVEPYRILQQAIAVSLARDHQVQLRESVAPTEVRNLKDCDLLILDASSLEEKELLTAGLLRALETCGTPLLWLEDEQSLGCPKTEKFQVLKKPLREKTLKEAIESLLAPQLRDQRHVEAEEISRPNDNLVKVEEGKTAAAASQQPSFEFIDLVEVVAEPGPQNRGGAPQKGT